MPTLNDASKVYFAPKAQVYMMDTATYTGPAVPTDLETALDPGWKTLGYVSEDGISLTPKREFDPVNATQSASPIKYVLKSAALTLKFTLLEFFSDTAELYFGDKLVTAGTNKQVTFSSNPSLVEKSLLIEYGDYTEVDNAGVLTITGTKNRLVIPRGMVSDADEQKIGRTEVTSLGVTFDAMDQGGSLGFLLTNAG